MEFPRAAEPLVPHRDAMCFLHSVLSADASNLVADLMVRGDGVFGDGSSVPAWVGIEYMAQAVAAWAGVRSAAGGGGPKLGFLLGTRRYNAYQPHFAHGSRLTVQVHCELLADNGLGMFSCRLLEGERLLADAQLSVFEPENADAFLENSTS